MASGNYTDGDNSLMEVSFSQVGLAYFKLTETTQYMFQF